MRYAIEKNGVALNVILAESQSIADHIASLDVATARLLADGETVAVPMPEPIREVQLTKLQFLRRFSQAERIAIRDSMNPIIVDFLKMLDLAQDVRLDDPDTIAGVGYLESLELIAAGRAAEILA
jgi:hypothetical protein